MKLMTDELKSKFKDFPLLSQDKKGFEAEVILKVFNPLGRGTWLITEGNKEGDDWLLFGYIHIFEWEWGEVLLSELESIHFLERDLYCGNKTVGQLKHCR